MENSRLGRLAGIADILTEAKKKKAKKWVAKVDTKWTPPEGFFSNSSTEIVKGLLAAPGGHAKAMSRLNFYINRAGSKLKGEDKERLEKAKDALSKKIATMKEEVEQAARRAGVVIERKKVDDNEDPDMELPADDSDASAEDPTDEDEENSLPKIVLKIAKKAVGKSEEELADLLMKVYDAGFKDGVKSTEEEEPKDDEEGEGKDKKDDKEKVDEAAKPKETEVKVDVPMTFHVRAFFNEGKPSSEEKIKKVVAATISDMLDDQDRFLDTLYEFNVKPSSVSVTVSKGK